MVLLRKTASFSRSGIVLAAALAVAASAQTYTYEVRHHHWNGSGKGTLRITPDSITYEELDKKGKKEKDSRQWTYDDIQQLEVSPSEVRILTYEDSKWKLGRDREYVFERIPPNLAVEVYPLLSRMLDQRFIAGMADTEPAAEWKLGAKLTGNVNGTMGTLLFSPGLIVFDAKKPNESRSWRIEDIQNVSTSGPLDLTITTNERTGFFRGGDHQFHFQLQQALLDERYNTLWREVNRSKGMTFLESQR